MKIVKKFKVYPDTSSQIQAKAIFIKGELTKVSLLTKMPRGQYYSVLNDAMFEAENLKLAIS